MRSTAIATASAVVRRNSRQSRANISLSLAKRRIIVDGEDTDTALAAGVDNICLAWERTVAVDAGVAARRDDVLVGESP